MARLRKVRLAWLVSAVISKDMPKSNELSDSSKSGMGVFSRVMVFLLKIYPPHMKTKGERNRREKKTLCNTCSFIQKKGCAGLIFKGRPISEITVTTDTLNVNHFFLFL